MKRAAMVAAIAVMALAAATSVASAAEIEGTVKSVDSTGQIVTLDNGTTLVLGPATAGDRHALKPGAQVKASYDAKDGKNMVTNIQVSPGKAAPMAPAQRPSQEPKK
jgi:hypothetical protein